MCREREREADSPVLINLWAEERYRSVRAAGLLVNINCKILSFRLRRRAFWLAGSAISAFVTATEPMSRPPDLTVFLPWVCTPLSLESVHLTVQIHNMNQRQKNMVHSLVIATLHT